MKKFLLVILLLLSSLFTLSACKTSTSSTHTITFDLNGGEQNAEYPLLPLEIKDGETFMLPELPELPEITLIEDGYKITIVFPKGKVFDAYEVDGARKNPNDEIVVKKDTVIKYLWKDVIYIHQIEATIDAPIVGTTIDAKKNDCSTQTNRPNAIVADNVDYYVLDEATYWYSGEYEVFVGEIEKDTTYNALIYFTTYDSQYQFADDLTVIINGNEFTEFDNMNFWVYVDYAIESIEKTWTVSFDLNGGIESESHPLKPIEIKNGETFYLSRPELPEIGYFDDGFYITVNCPDDKVFDAYEVDGVRKEPDDEIEIHKDTIIKYLWKDVIYIHQIEATIDAPIVGTTIDAKKNDCSTQTNRPNAIVADNVDYYVLDEATYWYSGEYEVFVGEIEKDTTYNALIYFTTYDSQYQFADDLTVIINGNEFTEFDNMNFWVYVDYAVMSVENNN